MEKLDKVNWVFKSSCHFKNATKGLW